MKTTKNILPCILLAVITSFAALGQQKPAVTATASTGPARVVRAVITDKKGDIWMAAFDGIFRYDGRSFTNMTRNITSARFFSVFEDRRGNLWFGSLGSGVYRYDGRSVKNFTTADGLISNDIVCIYQDKAGNIWLCSGDGVSRYDGTSFRNLKIKDVPPRTDADSLHISVYQKKLPENTWMHNDINCIVEDNTGKFWLGTRGYAYVYDGKAFTRATDKDGKPFANVRSMIKDRKGNIWLGGFDGLWRYDGSTYTNFTRNFVGSIYEDKKGNIWTGSQQPATPGFAIPRDGESPLLDPGSNADRWLLTRYDEKTLTSDKPATTEIRPKKGMICGMAEARDGSIWFGASDGVYRWDGKAVSGFKGE